jgi:uncharacterized protein YkwD
MSNHIRHIMLKNICLAVVAGIFLLAPFCLAYATDAGSTASADEMRMFELINAARKDPLGVAESIGMSRKKILKDFPELKDILVNGLPELNFDERLWLSAGDHSRDMFDNSYYAYDSIDGRTAADRMSDAGYTPVDSGESLGLLYFNNFINSEKAVKQLFNNMYRDELNPAWTGQRNILSADMKDIGICIGSGIFNFNGISGNVYISTCDFGSEIPAYELELMALINQARSKPKAVAKDYGLDVAKVIKDFPDLENVFLTGVPPVSFNSNLYKSSRNHALDMLANEYYSSKSKDGRTPESRIRDAGYEAVWSGESRMLISTCNTQIPPEETVNPIFRRMLLRSFWTQTQPDQNMFSEKAVDAGVGIVNGESSELGDACGNFVSMTVVDYAAPASAGNPNLMGIVYRDENENGLFDQGEGLPGVWMEIKDAGGTGARNILTNTIGGFSEEVPKGKYRVSVNAGEGEPLKKWVTVDNKTTNVWLSFDVPTLE